MDCWGSNFEGSATPPKDLKNVKDIKSPYFSSCAITWDHKVVCWGDQGTGGHKDVNLQFNEIKAFSVSDNHGCVIDSILGLQCWGNNESKQLDIPSDIDIKKVDDVVAGFDGICVLYKRKIRCWGNDKNKINDYIPNTIKGKIHEIKGQNDKICLRDDESIKCWGELEGFPVLLDNPLVSLDYNTLKQWNVRGWNACAIDRDNIPKCWMGLVSHTPLNMPKELPEFRVLSVGLMNVCIITKENKYLCWGKSRSFNNTRAPLSIQSIFTNSYKK